MGKTVSGVASVDGETLVAFRSREAARRFI